MRRLIAVLFVVAPVLALGHGGGLDASGLMKLAREGSYPAPKLCDIHVGSEDWQSQPEVVKEFGRLTSIAVTVVQGQGHDLGKDYVGPIIEKLCPTRITGV